MTSCTTLKSTYIIAIWHQYATFLSLHFWWASYNFLFTSVLVKDQSSAQCGKAKRIIFSYSLSFSCKLIRLLFASFYYKHRTLSLSWLLYPSYNFLCSWCRCVHVGSRSPLQPDPGPILSSELLSYILEVIILHLSPLSQIPILPASLAIIMTLITMMISCYVVVSSVVCAISQTNTAYVSRCFAVH